MVNFSMLRFTWKYYVRHKFHGSWPLSRWIQKMFAGFLHQGRGWSWFFRWKTYAWFSLVKKRNCLLSGPSLAWNILTIWSHISKQNLTVHCSIMILHNWALVLWNGWYCSIPLQLSYDIIDVSPVQLDVQILFIHAFGPRLILHMQWIFVGTMHFGCIHIQIGCDDTDRFEV